MAKRRKNPPNTAMLLTVAGGALLYLMLRKKAPISVPPAHAKQVQENLNQFLYPPLPVTGVYDEAAAARLVVFANWVDAASKLAFADYKNGITGGYELLSAKNGLFHNNEIVMLQVGDRTQQTTRSTYDYLFTRPVAPAGCDANNSCHYSVADKKYMIAARPVIPGITAGG